MSDDIADFLRRAAQRQTQASQPPLPQYDVEIVEDAEILEEDAATAEDIASHVAERMDTSDFGRRASSLSATVDQSDDRLESHLQDVFQHDLGQFRARGAAAKSPAALPETAQPAQGAGLPAAEGPSLADMLKDRNQLRNLIVLNEILRRPEFRW